MSKLNFLLFCHNEHYENIATMYELATNSFEEDETADARVAKCIGNIVEISERMGFRGNVWDAYLAYVIATDENPFSISCERKG